MRSFRRFGLLIFYAFYGSPKFLFSRDHDAEAVRVVHVISRFNGTTSTLREDSLRNVDDRITHLCASGSKAGEDRVENLAESGKARRRVAVAGDKIGHLKMMFNSTAMARLTILAWICYVADYWGFVVAGNFLPTFLAEHGAADSLSAYDTYRN